LAVQINVGAIGLVVVYHRRMTTAPWHADPALAGRFHPDHPNDLQVMVHDGEPRRTKRTPEACWVTVTGVHGALRMPVAPVDAKPPLNVGQVRFEERLVYAGTLLNEPKQLATARKGDTVLFMTAPGVPHPVRVTEHYLAERGGWAVTACNQCGADQALDPPTIMARTRFPDAPEGSIPIAFTAFCPCGGTMMLCLVEGAAPPAGARPEMTPAKPWWKFW
jgi:hypothetical protein